MQGLITAAAAAAEELRRTPLPSDRPATKQLANVVGEIISQRGMKNLNEKFWCAVLKNLKIQMEDAADIYFWVGNFSRETKELTVVHSEDVAPNATSVPEKERVKMVLRVCDAIAASA